MSRPPKTASRPASWLTRAARFLGLAAPGPSPRPPGGQFYRPGFPRQLLAGSFGGIPSGPWNRLVNAEWLGPYSPESVAPWTVKLIRKDPDVALGLAAVKSAFVGIEYRLKGGSPLSRAFLRKTVLESPLFPRLLRSILNAFDFGWQSHELVWGIEDVVLDVDGVGGEDPKTLARRYVLSKLLDLDPERVSGLALNEAGDLDHVLVDGLLKIPAEKVLHVVHEGEWGDPWGSMVVGKAYNPWYWENFLNLYAMHFFGTKSNPPLKGTGPWSSRYTEGEAREDQEGTNTLAVLGEQAMNLREGGFAGLPWEPDEHGNNQWSLEELATTDRTESFLSAIRHMKASKLRAVLVPDKVASQDETPGSYALADVRIEVFFGVLESIKRSLVLASLDKLSALLIRYNFGASAPVPRWDASELSRQKQGLLAEIVKKVLELPVTLENGKVVAGSDLIRIREALEALNVPLKSDAEIARTASKPPAPAPNDSPAETRRPGGAP